MIIDLNTKISNESWLTPTDMSKKLSMGKQTTSFKDIEKAMLPGDCILIDGRDPSTPMGAVAAGLRTVRMYLERVPFTSIKLVEDSKNVIGYGVTDKWRFDRANVDDFLSPVRAAALIRHTSMTKVLSKKLIKNAVTYQKVPYSVAMIVEGAIERLLKFDWSKDEAQKAVEERTPALFCSAVIAKLYTTIGLTVTPRPLEIYQIWPSDVLMSDFFEVIVNYKKKTK